MNRLGLRPYGHGDEPLADAVPVSVIVLTKNESTNIETCLASVAWAQQVIVVDSGSSDDTVARARAMGAEIVTEKWRGYGGQREFALRLPSLRYDWIYFVDADEWVSRDLAAEIASTLANPAHEAFAQRFRLIFQDRWIRHCGWYRGSWLVRLMKRSAAHFDSDTFAERTQINGSIGRLKHDLVDEDHKGLASWLRKHVGYAELEAPRRNVRMPIPQRWRRFRAARVTDTRPLARAIAKDLMFPSIPARPLAMFVYMYWFKLGFLDGKAGLRFCLYHAWYQLTIGALAAEATSAVGAAEEVRANSPALTKEAIS